MQTNLSLITLEVFLLIAVAGVGFYTAAKYAQSKATAIEQKQQSDGDYLTLKPSKQEKVERHIALCGGKF